MTTTYTSWTAERAVTTAKTWLSRSITAVAAQTTPGHTGQPAPLASLMPAMLISILARGMARDFATQARGQGATWLDVANAAGILTPGSDVERAEQAFEFTLGGVDAWDASVGWRCHACRAVVIDHGPYNGHPDDCETGHAPDCPRHLADLAAYHADDD
jgi:hypothetical protein